MVQELMVSSATQRLTALFVAQWQQQLILLALVFLYGCAVNPITGERELGFVSTEREIAIGKQQYAPSRQREGGDYTIDRELTEYVSAVGAKLVAQTSRKLPYEFTVLNNSVPNAWALPGGKIAINRGLLLQLNSEAELAAVLGHEIIHSAARHGAKSIERGAILQGAVLVAGVAASQSEYRDWITQGAAVGAQLISTRYGRDAELESDDYGMDIMIKAGYDPMGAVALQETFVKLQKAREASWIDGLFASHPPSSERVAKNRAKAQRVGIGGYLGVEEYAKRIATLTQRQGAYSDFDKARKALADEDINTAATLNQRARRKLPQEARFWGLKGDIEVEQKDLRQAVQSYGDAIAKDDGYFYYYLQRGLIRQQLNQIQRAEQDLQKSVALLPTNSAYNALGNLAEGRSDNQQAMAYYQQAIGSNSQASAAAQSSFIRLDFPQRPAQYMPMRVYQNNAGELFLSIKNSTASSIGNMVIGLTYQVPDENGNNQRFNKQQVLNGSLAANKTASIRLQLPANATNVSARLLKAKLQR